MLTTLFNEKLKFVKYDKIADKLYANYTQTSAIPELIKNSDIIEKKEAKQKYFS